MRSRVLGAIEGLFHGGLNVSFVAAAFVLPVVGARGMYAIAGVAAGLSAIVLLPLLGATPSRPVGRPPSSPLGSGRLAPVVLPG